MDGKQSLKSVQKLTDEMPESPVLTASEQQFLDEVKNIIQSGQKSALAAVNQAAVGTYWNIGKRIVEQEQNGNGRAEYGTYLLNILSESLTSEYGKNYSARNLRYFRQFYRCFPDCEIWTHFRALLRVDDEDARIWYLKEASEEGWSSRTLDRNIATQYFFRCAASSKERCRYRRDEGENGGIAKIQLRTGEKSCHCGISRLQK